MEEIWKDIPGYEGLYQVSNLGRVKSLERSVIKGQGGLYKIEEKIMKGSKDGSGYLFVQLCKEGKRKFYKIHRLVASAFLDNPNNLSELNHKDEDKTNNRVDNLEWCNHKYNSNYGSRNERVAKAISIPVLQFSKTGEFIHKWDSATEASRVLGINQGNIWSCLKGKYKSAYGFIWHYHYKSLWKRKHIPQIKLKKVA